MSDGKKYANLGQDRNAWSAKADPPADTKRQSYALGPEPISWAERLARKNAENSKGDVQSITRVVRTAGPEHKSAILAGPPLYGPMTYTPKPAVIRTAGLASRSLGPPIGKPIITTPLRKTYKK